MDTETKAQLLREARVAEREDKELAEAFAALLKHPSWLRYEATLNSLIQTRGEEVLSPANTNDRLVALEFVKGSMNGLILARDLPRVTIEAMKDETQSTGDA